MCSAHAFDVTLCLVILQKCPANFFVSTYLNFVFDFIVDMVWGGGCVAEALVAKFNPHCLVAELAETVRKTG